ncbi:MAG: UDP-N-acetylmuramoyl-tripeptide--D-alanyl-D-alanine ligase [Cytophagales bacterium]|nr:UDP-N-acetylmuramoyl-tripeptide--D-alanyl-D-alanine ligase [Cytophagales bacterium]MDW8383335.1 UDP-N-acetylmuramoyl-tripeptide--D-alanyl-D-alanine ligase [Flammeovirgaceae bacterium]
MISIENLYEYFLEVHQKISTDTRNIQPKSMFFALKGKNFDGNTFAQEALQKGASYVVIDNPAYLTDERCLLVNDVLTSLQELANFHRKYFQIPVIAITGSNGKTTTKELITKVLQTQFLTHATAGNYNNHIGLPLTLLSTPLNAQMIVLEMGDNKLGDIALLCKIAQPTHGIITNIGKDHIEGFGSWEANIRAKSELFDFLLQNQGVPFINTDDEVLANMAKRFQNAILYADNHEHARFIETSPFIVYESNQIRVQTQLIGKYNFANILTAIVIGKYFGIQETSIHRAIASYVPTNNRSQLLEKNTNQIVADAYNANPSSMEAALENFADWKTNKHKVIILGDMLELGDIAEEEHLHIVQKLSVMDASLKICIGEHFMRQQTDGILFFKEKQEAIEWLKNNPIQNALILLKGSRGMKLETLIDVF